MKMFKILIGIILPVNALFSCIPWEHQMTVKENCQRKINDIDEFLEEIYKEKIDELSEGWALKVVYLNGMKMAYVDVMNNASEK